MTAVYIHRVLYTDMIKIDLPFKFKFKLLGHESQARGTNNYKVIARHSESSNEIASMTSNSRKTIVAMVF